MPLLAALLPILGPLLAGTPLATVVGGITLTQWIGLGGAVLGAAPSELTALNQIAQAIQPAFGQFISKLTNDVKNANSPHAAAASAVGWFAQNGQGAINQVQAKDKDA